MLPAPAVESGTSLLAATGLGRRAPGGTAWLLQDVSLSISAGERWALLGPSGSGKTLLLRTLARLDPFDTGSLNWRGGPVLPGDVPEYRHQVLYLHQRPTMFEGTVEDNLRVPFRLKRHRARAFDRLATVERLRLLARDESFLTRNAADLSGGESQIVALLRGLQLDPTLLLLDEPTAALDSEASQAIESLVSDWFAAAPHDRAYVWVSHNAGQARRMTSHLLQIQEGRVEKGGRHAG